MLNTNFKRYNLFNILAFIFFGECAYYLGVFAFNHDIKFLLISIIQFLVCILFGMVENHYFNKTYQLKKNAKKEFTKENKNK